MTWTCERLQETLADEGVAFLRAGGDALEHLEACPDCLAFLEALIEVDEGFGDLPPIAPPKETVTRTLASLARESAEATSASPAEQSAPRAGHTPPTGPDDTKNGQPRPRLLSRFTAWTGRGWAALAGMFSRESGWRRPVAALAGAALTVTTLIFLVRALVPDGSSRLAEKPPGDVEDEEAVAASVDKAREAPGMVPPGAPLKAKRKSTSRPSLSEDDRFSVSQQADREGRARENKGDRLSPAGEATVPAELEASRSVAKRTAHGTEQMSRLETLLADRRGASGKGLAALPSAIEPALGIAGRETAGDDGKATNGSLEAPIGRHETWESLYDIDLDTPDLDPSLRAYVKSRTALAGLTFQAPAGYWANTYVPGDPGVRHIQAAMTGERYRELLAAHAPGLDPTKAIRRIDQPFDPPAHAALAIYLGTDRASVAGPSRMIVQVGLKATEQRAGRRPTMTAGIVLDATGPLEPDTLESFRALIEAFMAARDVGDRFLLAVAGRRDIGIVEPGDFRYGPLTVLLDQLGQEPGNGSSPPRRAADRPPSRGLDLPGTVRQVRAMLEASSDPASPLGSTVIVVITSRTLPEQELAELESASHVSAVSGVPVSAIGVGTRVDPAQVDRIVLAGEGNRRLMSSIEDAQPLVEREIDAAARIVARAVRLRIQLARGVKLVDVLGSHRLGGAETKRVKASEEAIDRRIARSLGIAADRGEDEAGIQVVIPVFMAGDSHVILLDVVVPGPGPVVEASVRFKDLVFLDNGVARATLATGNEPAPPGPLEVNVLKNLLAHQVSHDVRTAAKALAAHKLARAVAVLENTIAVLEGLERLLAPLNGDPKLNADIRLLRILTAMIGGVPREDVYRNSLFLADAYTYCAYLNLYPPPKWY